MDLTSLWIPARRSSTPPLFDVEACCPHCGQSVVFAAWVRAVEVLPNGHLRAGVATFSTAHRCPPHVV